MYYPFARSRTALILRIFSNIDAKLVVTLEQNIIEANVTDS